MKFDKDGECKAPYAFPFIVLPLILHSKTRMKLPKSSRTTFSAWITKEENASIKVDFADRAKNMAPYIREALLFGMKYKRLSINLDGMIVLTSKTKSSIPGATIEVKDCIRTAELCGKWFSTMSDLESPMILLGIQP